MQVDIFMGLPVLQRTFGTNYTAAELSNIQVNGVVQTAGVDYNLVTRSGDGNADIVFTPGHGPADGAAITADLTSPGSGWVTDGDINTSLSQVSTALETLRATSKGISSSSNILTTRFDFTKDMIDTLKTGADNLTLADMNEESANMLMLQTRQSLSTTSLSIASQAAQSVLRLFR
jgi:flagellin-like hook-associated protein FlgL